MSARGGLGAARFIGERMPRKEDARLLTGRGQFTDDITEAGLLHVAFVRSPIARGRITSIDLNAAQDMPGVHAILTADDLASKPVTFMSFYLSRLEIEVPPLATDHVAYVGDPVAMVVADSRSLAEDAASVVEVHYEEEAAVVTIPDAMAAEPIHPGTENNVAAAMGDEIDEDLEEVFANAAHVVEETITHQRIAQSPMEGRGVVVSPHGEEVTVHLSCQSPHLTARYLTECFGLPPSTIRVIAKDVGGSFGLKVQPWREEVATVAAGMILGRPLKWIEDRWENLVAANQAREQECTIKVAFDEEGRLLGAYADYHINNGAYPHGADCNIAVAIFLWAAYKMPQFGFSAKGWFSNTAGLAAYRGPWAMESLVRETVLDIAARKIGIDPVEIRRRNLLTRDDQPVTTSMGVELEDITPTECLDKLLRTLDVAAFRKEQEAARKEGRYLGLGIATYIEPTGAASIEVLASEFAEVRIEPSGKVTAVVSTHSQGHGTQTTMAQIIAEELGVAYEDVQVFEDDSTRGGFGAGASGSRQAVAGGGACIGAARRLREKLQKVAAHMLNARPEDVVIANGVVSVPGAEEMDRPLRDIATIAYGEPDRLPPEMEPGLEAHFRYQPPPITFTSAAHACIVEVDAETGMVTINRWISSEDCGVIINPAMVEGQIAGGLAQAIGTVLLEEVGYDERGNPTTVTYKDYKIPTITDVPDIEYLHVSTPSKSDGGFRGVGEGGAIIGPPTLVNAIADALAPFGAKCLDLPLTPSKILALMEGKDISRAAARKAKEEARAAAADSSASSSEKDELPSVGAAIMPGQPETASAPEEPAGVVVDGDWDMVLSTPMGPQEIVAHFETDGTSLRGELRSDQGNQDFEGTVEGNRLLFDLKVTKPMKITLKYELSLEGDTAVGTCKMGMFGKAKVRGRRSGT